MYKNTVWDVAIIGGGIGGIMCAYELITNNPDLKICILDKGNAIDSRVCPASKGKPCAHCTIHESQTLRCSFAQQELHLVLLSKNHSCLWRLGLHLC